MIDIEVFHLLILLVYIQVNLHKLLKMVSFHQVYKVLEPVQQFLLIWLYLEADWEPFVVLRKYSDSLKYQPTKTFLSFGHLKVWIEFFIRSTFFKNWSFWFYQVCQLGLCWSICIPRQDQFLSFNRFKNDFIDFSPSKIFKKYFRKMNSSLDDSYLVWK